ncbi:MAG: lipopolysaccharide biosynthesis protein [Terriglobales bacterium]
MIKQRSFSNALKWSYSASWGEKAFTALFTVILAGILGPRDFGMISIALIYIGFLNMFQDQGLVAALIQRKDLQQEHSDAVFWMNQFLSFVLVGISIALGGWWAAKNHAPEAARFIFVLSLSIPIEGLTVVQTALLKRDMDFRTLSIRSNISVVTGGIVGLGMAFGGFGAWSLVGQIFGRDLTALVLLWKMSAWRPHLEFSWKHLRELMSFSVSNFIAQLGIFADMQSASVLIGLLFGPVAVGLYRLADRVMSSVMTMATASIQAVALPEFSRRQNNPDQLRQSALSCIRVSSIVTLPALAGLAAVSGPLMAMIGAQWLPAANVLKILSLLGMFVMFAFFTGPLLQALHLTHKLAVLEWARTVIGVAFIVGTGLMVRNSHPEWHLMAITLARFVPTVFVVTPAFLYILMKICDISAANLMAAVWPSFAASIGAVASVSLCNYSNAFSGVRPMFVLVTEVVIGGAAGLVVLVSTDSQLRDKLRTIIQRAFGLSPVVSQ